MMEFTIKRDYFINQLNDTLKAISPRTTLPILTGIKIDAKDNEVILTGSDSEISIEITIPKQVDGEDIVEISETGSVVLPGRFFVDIIKSYLVKMLNYLQMNSSKHWLLQDIQNLT